VNVIAPSSRSAVDAYRDILVHEAIRRDAHETVDLQPGDAYVQGDVFVARIDIVPDRFGEWEHGKQLAPGETLGSRHTCECGDVDIYVGDPGQVNAALDRLFPKTKGKPRLIGPCVRAFEPWTEAHPEHGDRTFPAQD
jgi:hypothetical protein